MVGHCLNFLLAYLVIGGLKVLCVILSAFISATFYFTYYRAKYVESPPTNGSEYDYIVVGSGSSGSVVAGRLAESGYRVLLVEAGGPSHFLQVSKVEVRHSSSSLYHAPNANRRKRCETEINGSALSFLKGAHDINHNRYSWNRRK